ncbi:MAG: site-specific integrase [Nitrospira sp.]|nr:site-specific integrase [Nitrospira sp.]
MGIRARGPNYLIDVTVNGVRRTATRHTREEAEIAEAKLRADLLKTAGRATDQGTWTLAQALERTASVSWSDRVSGAKLTRNAEMAVEFFGPATSLTEITPDKLDEYAAHLARQGNASGTINRKLAAVSKMLTIAVARGKLAKKPTVPRRREGEGRVRFLSEQEEAACLGLLTQWDKTDHLDAFVVLIDTGLRGGEVWRLEGRDCDIDRGLITVWQTKNGKPRTVPMSDRVKPILEHRRMLYPIGPLFPGMDNYRFERTWDRMRTILGFSEDVQFVPYALRHTCASRLVQRGVNLRVVQEWMGHKTITVTQRYAHLSPTDLLLAVKVLNRQPVSDTFQSVS